MALLGGVEDVMSDPSWLQKAEAAAHAAQESAEILELKTVGQAVRFIRRKLQRRA